MGSATFSKRAVLLWVETIGSGLKKSTKASSVERLYHAGAAPMRVLTGTLACRARGEPTRRREDSCPATQFERPLVLLLLPSSALLLFLPAAHRGSFSPASPDPNRPLLSFRLLVHLPGHPFPSLRQCPPTRLRRAPVPFLPPIFPLRLPIAAQTDLAVPAPTRCRGGPS